MLTVCHRSLLLLLFGCDEAGNGHTLSLHWPEQFFVALFRQMQKRELRFVPG
jgi:hypothetical protein